MSDKLQNVLIATTCVYSSSWGYDTRYNVGLLINKTDKVAFVVAWHTTNTGEYIKNSGGIVCPCCTSDERDIMPLENKVTELKESGEIIDVYFDSSFWSDRVDSSKKNYFLEQGRTPLRHIYKRLPITDRMSHEVYRAMVEAILLPSSNHGPE